MKSYTGALMVLFLLLLALPLGGCGKSQCEQLCWDMREKLINNFGIPPVKINCSGDKWQVDCDKCVEMIQAEFDVMPGPGACKSQ